MKTKVQQSIGNENIYTFFFSELKKTNDKNKIVKCKLFGDITITWLMQFQININFFTFFT